MQSLLNFIFKWSIKNYPGSKKVNVLKNKIILMMGAIFACMFNFSAAVQADQPDPYLEPCQYLQVVSAALNNKQNSTVCVDAPTTLKKVQVIFDINSESANGSTGLKHMMMMATALKGRVNAGTTNPEQIHVIGILHGTGINYVLKDSMVPDSAETKYINAALKIANEMGFKLSFEVCGATMWGRGKTADDLYVPPAAVTTDTIHINQGAIARMVDLQNMNFALIKE